MKKVWILVLALLLVCHSAFASEVSSVTDYVRNTYQYTPYQAEQESIQNALNLIVSSDNQAIITWTDSELSRIYAIEDSADALLAAYCSMISLMDWDSCTVYIDQQPIAAYGASSTAETILNSLGDFESFVDQYFSIDDPTSELDSIGAYVVNTNTKKFHYPDCPSVNQMKQKNRQDYTGSRDDLIAQGYKPCGNCKP